MLKKLLALGLLVCAAFPSAALAAGSAPATVGVTATVDTFAEWANAAPNIGAADWNGHVNAVNQTRTASLAMTLMANISTTLTPTAGTNAGVLTNGTDTLATSYMITGEVGTADVAFKATGTTAGQFFHASNTYTVTHVAGDGAYTLNLGVQAVSPSTRAPDAGDYTGSLTVTAAWL